MGLLWNCHFEPAEQPLTTVEEQQDETSVPNFGNLSSTLNQSALASKPFRNEFQFTPLDPLQERNLEPSMNIDSTVGHSRLFQKLVQNTDESSQYLANSQSSPQKSQNGHRAKCFNHPQAKKVLRLIHSTFSLKDAKQGTRQGKMSCQRWCFMLGQFGILPQLVSKQQAVEIFSGNSLDASNWEFDSQCLTFSQFATRLQDLAEFVYESYHHLSTNKKVKLLFCVMEKAPCSEAMLIKASKAHVWKSFFD